MEGAWATTKAPQTATAPCTSTSPAGEAAAAPTTTVVTTVPPSPPPTPRGTSPQTTGPDEEEEEGEVVVSASGKRSHQSQSHLLLTHPYIPLVYSVERGPSCFVLLACSTPLLVSLNSG